MFACDAVWSCGRDACAAAVRTSWSSAVAAVCMYLVNETLAG